MTPALFASIMVEVCLPIFAVVGMGWLIDRKFQLSLETLVKVNLYLLVPSFIFVRLISTPMSGGVAFGIMGAVFSVVLLAGALALIVARMLKMNLPARKSLALASMFGNCGNFGIPLVTLAFGPEGAAVQVYVLVTMNISTFTVGLLLASSEESHGGNHWKALTATLRQPTIHAVLLAASCKALDLHPEKLVWLWQPLKMQADALVGVALLTLGVQLSKTRPAPLHPPLLSALSIRLIAAPLLMWAVTSLAGFSPLTSAVLILTAGAPTAVNTALLSHEFKGDTSFATASVYYSTLLSLVTTSLSLTLLRVWML